MSAPEVRTLEATPVGPYRLPTPAENTKLGIWVWLASDCALFAALIATYVSMHGHVGHAPTPQQLFDLPLTATATFVLLLSSLTMGLGLEAAQHGEHQRLMRWLVVTMILGLAFVGLQAVEFTTYVHRGLTPDASNFGASFFTLVGFHGLHVTFGVAWLLSIFIFVVRKGPLGPRDLWRLEAASLYWYFVDVVWVVIFTVVYLLGKVS